VAGGASGGGWWPSSGGRRARGGRHAGRRVAGDGRATRCEDGRTSRLARHLGGQWQPSSGGQVSCGRARGGRRSRMRVGRRARGWRRTGRWPGELRPRSRREARRAVDGGRWSGSALRGRAGERTGAASAGAADGAAPGRAVAAEQRLWPRSRRATEPHAW